MLLSNFVFCLSCEVSHEFSHEGICFTVEALLRLQIAGTSRSLGWSCLVVSVLCPAAVQRDRVRPRVVIGLVDGCVLETPA